MKGLKVFGTIVAIVAACVIIRQVINTQTGYNIPYFSFNTFYEYLKGFNGSIITENINQAFITIQSFLNSFKDFSFIDALTILPKIVFMMFNLSLSVIKIIYGVFYFLFYIMGFISYLFKGYI